MRYFYYYIDIDVALPRLPDSPPARCEVDQMNAFRLPVQPAVSLLHELDVKMR